MRKIDSMQSEINALKYRLEKHKIVTQKRDEMVLQLIRDELKK